MTFLFNFFCRSGFFLIFTLISISAEAEICKHTVISGDALSRISQKIYPDLPRRLNRSWRSLLYSSDGVMADLMKLNPHVKNIHYIYPKQVIYYECQFDPKLVKKRGKVFPQEELANKNPPKPKNHLKARVEYYQVPKISKEKTEIRKGRLLARAKPPEDGKAYVVALRETYRAKEPNYLKLPHLFLRLDADFYQEKVTSLDLKRNSRGVLYSNYSNAFDLQVIRPVSAQFDVFGRFQYRFFSFAETGAVSFVDSTDYTLHADLGFGLRELLPTVYIGYGLSRRVYFVSSTNNELGFEPLYQHSIWVRVHQRLFDIGRIRFSLYPEFRFLFEKIAGPLHAKSSGEVALKPEASIRLGATDIGVAFLSRLAWIRADIEENWSTEIGPSITLKHTIGEY